MVLLALAGTSSAAAAAPQVYAESASIKVKADTAPKSPRVAQVSAARNEFAAFQVVVKADSQPLTGLRAAATPLESMGSQVPESAITLYREELMNITQPSGTIGQQGRFPDALIPARDELDSQTRTAFPFDVPAGESRAIWVDVLVPPNTVPGMYRGQIRLSANGFQQSVPVELEVWNFQLPSTPSLSSAFLVFMGAVCRAHTGHDDCGGSDKAAELAAKYERLALEHRITLPNVFVVHNQGNDWSAFDGAFGPLLDGTARVRLSGAKMTSAEYTWDKTPDGYRSFAQHFRARGWFDRAFDYTADEPPYGSKWGDIPPRQQAVKAGDPDFKTLVTTNIQAATQNGVLSDIDILAPIVNNMESTQPPFQGNQRKQYDAFLSAGKQKALWLYQSCMSHGCSFGGDEPGTAWPSYMIDVSAVRNRIMQWADFRFGVSGELYYETAETYGANPWVSQYEFNGNGDGTLFYPGTPDQVGGTSQIPIASLRLKMIRAGMQDYEYLAAVARMGDPNFAHRVADGVLPNAYTAGGDDPKPIEAAREKLAMRLLELRRSNPDLAAKDPVFSGSIPCADSVCGASGEGCSQGGRNALPMFAAAPLAALALLRRRRSRRAQSRR